MSNVYATFGNSSVDPARRLGALATHNNHVLFALIVFFQFNFILNDEIQELYK